MEPTVVTLDLINSFNKFDETDLVVCQRSLRAMANLVHTEFSEILDGQLYPEPLYRTRRGHGRPSTWGVTTSSSALSDDLEGEEQISGMEGGNDGGQREEIPR